MSYDLMLLPGSSKDYRMISNDMILETLKVEDERKQWSPEEFQHIRFLNLAHKNICMIANIGDFTSLTRLNLSNNSIEKITGLENLTNIEVLDLSFNRLTSIDGIKHLHKLTDLSLNNNNITAIDPLMQLLVTVRSITGIPEYTHPLQILNLSSTNISGLQQAITVLREFKNLTVLSMDKSPCTSAANYRQQVIAYVPQLRYLDYKVIMNADKALAREVYKMELISFEEKDSLSAQSLQKALNRSRQVRVDAAADCLGLETMTDREFLETEQSTRVFLIPAVKIEAFGKFRATSMQILKDLARLLRRRRILKLGEVAEFEEAYATILATHDSSVRRIIETFEFQKQTLLDRFAATTGIDLSHSEALREKMLSLTKAQLLSLAASAHDASQGVVAAVTDNVAEMRAALMNQEVECVADVSEIVDQLTANITTICNKTAELAQMTLTKVRELVLSLHETSVSLLQRAMELKFQKESGMTVALGAGGQTDLSSTQMADGADTTQGQATAITTGNINEIQSLLPAEMTQDVLSLLKDKASVTSAAVTAHEARMGAIDLREDAIIAAQKEYADTSMKIILASEAARNRRHVLDIDSLCKAEEKWIKEWSTAVQDALRK